MTETHQSKGAFGLTLDDFRQPRGLPYIDFLNRLHQKLTFDWYMEIGCRKGDSFAHVRSKTIGVDPAFAIVQNVIHKKPALLLFQDTSDDFFENNIVVDFNAVKIDFSFLDGMHQFEFLLRDFMNVEKRSAIDGVSGLHDCCPYNLNMTVRDVREARQPAWTGDVWKLIPILREYRPDLTIDVLDCPPTGLVMVSNLDPSNRSLDESYDKIVSDYADVNIVQFGLDRFYSLFDFVSASSIEQDDYPMFPDRVKND